MTINIVAVGKIKEDFFRSAIAEYSKRLSRFCKLNIIEVSESKLSGSDVKKVISIEGKDVLAKLNGYVIALDLAGVELTSQQIAENITSLTINGISEITFVIGGSYGLSTDVIKRANLSLCFGKVTYPHQLMRVILCEQVYRAFMINEGSEYHK